MLPLRFIARRLLLLQSAAGACSRCQQQQQHRVFHLEHRKRQFSSLPDPQALDNASAASMSSAPTAAVAAAAATAATAEYVGPGAQSGRCLADLANETPVLRQLMSLGVDLSRAEAVPGAADLLASLDFEMDVKPRLALLQEFGFVMRESTAVFAAFPKIFATPLPAIRERLAYFVNAGFAKAPAMLSRQSTILAMSPAAVDARLAHLQRLYALSNEQLVSTITDCPKAVTFPAEHISAVRTCLVKGLQFNKDQARIMVCLHPPLMVSELSRLYRNFSLLTGYKFSQDLLARNPLALVKQPSRVAARLRFLVELGKGQFDPELPLYVSLTEAVSGADSEFCSRIAGCSAAKYRAFLKTL